MWNISLDIQLSILLYDVIHLKLTLIGCHYLLACPVNQPESNILPLSALPAATLRPDLLLQLPWLALFPTWQWSMFAKIPMVRKAIMESLRIQGFRICAYFSDPLHKYWDIWTYRFSQSTVNYCTSSLNFLWWNGWQNGWGRGWCDWPIGKFDVERLRGHSFETSFV